MRLLVGSVALLCACAALPPSGLDGVEFTEDFELTTWRTVTVEIAEQGLLEGAMIRVALPDGEPLLEGGGAALAGAGPVALGVPTGTDHLVVTVTDAGGVSRRDVPVDGDGRVLVEGGAP